jgi:hypothetical protein
MPRSLMCHRHSTSGIDTVHGTRIVCRADFGRFSENRREVELHLSFTGVSFTGISPLNLLGDQETRELGSMIRPHDEDLLPVSPAKTFSKPLTI